MNQMKRTWRGLLKMIEVFGLQFVLAIAGTVALLLFAVFHLHGGLAMIAGLICVLLAIRAHDFVDEEEPTEVDASYDQCAGLQWTDEDRIKLMQQRRDAGYSRSVITVLGQNREGSEL